MEGNIGMKLATIIIALALPLATAALAEPLPQPTILAAVQSKPATAIKKKKGEACPANTNDCHPRAWCCVKPSICISGGCSRP
jgi:hypothetical protein